MIANNKGPTPTNDIRRDGDEAADPFAALLAKAKTLNKGDEAALTAFIGEILAAPLSADMHHGPLIKAAARASCFELNKVRELVGQAKVENAQRARSTPQALEAERIVREAERKRLRQSCGEIAMSKTLLADMEKVVHDTLGVIGESASIRGAYLAATSRLLKKNAISYLRRGAAAAGKNHLLLAVLRLIPEESVLQISSATPMALIYEGKGENDVDALKGKVILIVEATILARRANGDEHPMTGMLRILLSEGKLDHRLPVTQAGAVPKSVHIRRDGPVSLFITSAREDIEPEMLTRLLSSDADETAEQTLKVVDRIYANDGRPVDDGGIERWRDHQRWLQLDAPYDVVIPFSEAIAKAWRALVRKYPAALQLRIRRDATALKAAIEASAVLHKAQRKTDKAGRIIAEIADYENAHAAFNDGMAALYDLRPTDAIVAALEAVAEIIKTTPSETNDEGDKSHKITVQDLRKKLGVASTSTAKSRLEKLIDHGALEEDTSKHGQGRGSPRFYKIRKTKFDPPMRVNAFPAVSDVEIEREIERDAHDNFEEGGEGSKEAERDEQDAEKDSPTIDVADENREVSCSTSRSIHARQAGTPNERDRTQTER